MIKTELSSHSPSERGCQQSHCFENRLTPAVRKDYIAKRSNLRQRHTEAQTILTKKINVSDFLTINTNFNSLQNSIVKSLSRTELLAPTEESQYIPYNRNEKMTKLRKKVVKPFCEFDRNKIGFFENANRVARKGVSSYIAHNHFLTPARISQNSFLQNYKNRMKISHRKTWKRGERDASLIYMLSKIAVKDPSLSRLTLKPGLKCK